MNMTINESESYIASLYLASFAEFNKLTNGSTTTYNISLICLSMIAFYLLNVNKYQKRKLTSKQVMELNKKRKPGHWVPDYDFKTPVPNPYKNWDIKNTKPLPYRAFRHKYTINMGIRSMNWEEWIELDNEWLKFHNAKLDRLKERGEELYGTAPEAREAAYELLDELWMFLPNRYPTLFRQTKKGLDNLVTGESFSFRKGYRTNEDPMYIAAHFTQDDLAIMIEGEDGQYFLKAGAIILPGFWKFSDKFNMSLNEIHFSGDVPSYKEKLQNGMQKFFTRQTPDKPVNRNNYFIQLDDDLGWSHSIGGEGTTNIGWNTAEDAASPEQLYFRSERQSLRKLPISGATVFTIRTYFMPISKLVKEPNVPKRLLDGMSTWDENVQVYKGYHKFKDVLVPYLQEKAKEQEENGTYDSEKPDTYPF